MKGNSNSNGKRVLPWDTRCPRCNGFLYDAVFNSLRFAESFKNMVYCTNCARFYQLEGNRLIQWPRRDGDAGYEIKTISLSTSFDSKAKKSIKRR